MGNNSCSLRICSCCSLFISLIVGMVFGILSYWEFTPGILLVTYIALGLGALILIFIVIGTFLSTTYDFRHLATCARRKLPGLMIGTFGNIMTTIITLAIGMDILIPLAIFSGIGAFFFSLMILSLINFIQCILCITSKEAI